MTRTLFTICSAVVFTASLAAQPQTPATQPVRPPDRRPTGEPTRPLPAPEPAPAGTRDDERPLNRLPTPESGDVETSDLTLKGCLERVNARAFRLRQAPGDDGTVTEDVRLQGALEEMRPLVGRLVEVRGTYEQATPATTDPYFSVARVRQLAANCEAK